MKRRNEVKKLLAGVLVLGMIFIAGIAMAQQGTQNNPNPTHSIDLSHAKTTVNNITNAGAVSTSTGTVHGSTSTVHVTTPPPGSIPGSGGRANDLRQMKNNPPPPPPPPKPAPPPPKPAPKR
jgi:cytoskeletal protein RodZ